jgi:hypothetical protein
LLPAGALILALAAGPGLSYAASASATPSGGAANATIAKKHKSKCKRAKKKKARAAACSAPTAGYAGTMSTTATYLGCLTGQQTTQLPVTVTTGPPLRSTRLQPAVGRENNPLRIVIGQPTAAAGVTSGAVSMASAQRFAGTFPAVILQYWNLTKRGAAVSGVLTQDHTSEAAAYNLLASITELAPCFPNFGFYVNLDPIAVGATLNGTISPTAVQLQLSGGVVNQSRRFTSNITAVRSG